MTYGEGAGFPLWRAYFGEEGGGVELSVLEFQKECAIAWGARKENSDVTVYVGDQRDRELLRRIIAERVLEEQVVRAVTVTVAKPHVAIRHVLDDVSVTLHLERDAR